LDGNGNREEVMMMEWGRGKELGNWGDKVEEGGGGRRKKTE
jgi:hypothetical protein